MEISQLGAKSLANYIGSKMIFAAETPTDATKIFSAGSENEPNESFVQNVLQALQNLGIDSVDNEAVHIFTQNLYRALTQNNDTSMMSPLQNVTGIESATTDIPAPLILSGGTNFKYSVDFSEADFGDFLPRIQANITTALDNIGKYIRSDAVFNLKVLAVEDSSNMLAQANAAIVATQDNPDNVNADTTFIADSVRGADFDSTLHDSKLYINTAKLDQMSFTGLPTPDKYDLTSILTHEILHGLAFTGLVDSPDTKFKTAYDGLISTKEDGSLVFVGRHAKTVNGGKPVPLSPVEAGSGSAYYHVAIPNDLMSPSIRKNEVKSISNLNVAMLNDMGVGVTGVLPTNLKFQNAYSSKPNFVNSLESLSAEKASALQADFSNLVQSNTVNFQDFLTQLTANINESQNTHGAGSLFFATV
jgi:hypothetical protein